MASNKTTSSEAVSAALPTSSRAAKCKGTPNTHRAAGTTKFPKEVIQLYEAIKYGTTGKINHSVIGIKEPAARMWYMRLIRNIKASLKKTKVPKEDADKPKEAVDENKASLPMEAGDGKQDEASIVAFREKN